MSANLRHWMPAVLAVLVTAGFFSMLGVMLFKDVPLANKDMLNIMLGALGSGWLMCLGFYVGTTAASAKKDDTISQMSKPAG